MNQGLVGSPRQERADDVGINDVGQLIALLGETANVVTEGLIWLLPIVLEVPRVPRAHVGALKVPHEDLLQVHAILDGVGRKVVQPCPEQGEVADDEVVTIRATGLVGKPVVLKPKARV
jgi:hypothetical protein